jgi:hypothetical protein
VKRAATVFAYVCTVLFAILVAPRNATRVLFSTVSPGQRYTVEVSQYRPFPFDERAVFLNVYRDGRTLVVHKLLYTGDFLDSDFRDLYPNPRFRSEAIYELGDVMNDGPTVRPGNLRIVNATQKEISYLLIETSGYKLVVLDLKAGATTALNLQYIGGLSCQAQFAGSGQRLSSAVSIADSADSKENRQFSITVSDVNVAIESPQPGLRQDRCCASDRPDPQHEWLY